MVKFLKNQDIQITNFAVAKQKTANNLFLDLILANDENYSFPLLIPISECNYNFNTSNVSGSLSTIYDSCQYEVLNESGYLACSPIDNENNPSFQIGLKYTSDIPFYPVDSIYYNANINPINSDGTYRGQVYNTIKNMYYNNYNNAYDIFGFDGYNTEKANLNLDNEFTLYSLHVTQSGDRIRPFSITISNQTGDIAADIKDDGLNNLFLSGTYFINNFEKFANNTDGVINYCQEGLAKYICTSEFTCV
jgi:hypothetical protein